MKYYLKRIKNGFCLILVCRNQILNKFEIVEWIVKPKTFNTNHYEAEEFENKNGKEIRVEDFNKLYILINKQLKWTSRKFKL